MNDPIMKYFAYAHLQPPLWNVSKQVCALADEMNATLPDGPEKSAGLRKLLEAKDCFVRAKLDEKAVISGQPPARIGDLSGK